MDLADIKPGEIYFWISKSGLDIPPRLWIGLKKSDMIFFSYLKEHIPFLVIKIKSISAYAKNLLIFYCGKICNVTLDSELDDIVSLEKIQNNEI